MVRSDFHHLTGHYPTHAFDTWFKAQVKLLTGVDPEQAPLGPPTTYIFDSAGPVA
jgi:hypothetical protein